MAINAVVGLKVRLSRRLEKGDARYSGDLVAGAKILELFGAAMTELCLKSDGVEGLLRAYESVDFLAPNHPGDELEITAEMLAVGKTSRKIRCEARRLSPDPRVVSRAVAPCVCRRP